MIKNILFIFVLFIFICCSSKIEQQKPVKKVLNTKEFLYSEKEDISFIFNEFDCDTIKIKGRWKQILNFNAPHYITLLSNDTLLYFSFPKIDQIIKVKGLSQDKIFEKLLNNRLKYFQNRHGQNNQLLKKGNYYGVYLKNKIETHLIGVKKDRACFITYSYPNIVSQEKKVAFLIDFYNNLK